MISQYLEIKDLKNGEKGIFTKIFIPKNKSIIEVSGEIHTEKTMPDPNHPAWIQITNKLFIGPSGGKDDYIRHNCNPNSYLHVVGKRAIVYSLYDILPNSEITFDYSTTSTDTLDTWKINCNCGSYNCRKIISGYQYLDENLKKEYENKGIVPLFITNGIFKNI